jgi:hypothetical protein
MGVSKSEEVEINVVGSSKFGRYPKIDTERTYNMFISDNWLISYAGFKKQSETNINNGIGRGIYNSVRGGFLIFVINSTVFRANSNLAPFPIGNIATLTGDVYIDENLNDQICIVDGKKAYIYNYSLTSPTFTEQTLIDTVSGSEIFPNYVCYHNTFFLFGSALNSVNPQNWYVFQYASPTTISMNTQLALQTKPDTALAVERLPGRGNNVLVLGSTVSEVWTQVGGDENYRRVQSFNIDYGLVSTSTLASSEEYICWLGKNEHNSSTIMITDGSSSKRLSTDGIDYVLGQLQHPEQSAAFFYRQDGHLFYQLTFYNPADNLTLIYDFNTNLFFHVSNENLDYHPARQVVFYQGKTYFISLDDSALYLMDTNLLTYDYSVDTPSVGAEIPRIRICNTVRRKNSDRFRAGQFTFWIEQGVNQYHAMDPPVQVIPRVDMSFSKNGNQSFSNIVGHDLNPQGQYRNQIRWARCGTCNELTIQLRFWGLNRWCLSNGILNIY